jgi:type II secretory pathway component PulM
LLNGIEQTQAKINQLNTTLSLVDQLSEEIQTLEKSLVTLNEQLQDLILTTYGRNSPEARRVASVRRSPPRRRNPPSPENPATDAAA